MLVGEVLVSLDGAFIKRLIVVFAEVLVTVLSLRLCMGRAVAMVSIAIRFSALSSN